MLGLSAAAAGLLAIPDPSASHKLVRRLSELRVGGLRFFHASASPFRKDQYTKTLQDTEVFMLTAAPDSEKRTKLHGLSAVGHNNLKDAAEDLNRLLLRHPFDAALINDLGVVHWGLGEKRPSEYLSALGLFERAAKLSPFAAAPRFNLAVAYKKLELHDLANQAREEYLRVENSDFWEQELSDDPRGEADLIDALQKELQAGRMQQANAFLDRYPTVYRAMALDLALNPKETDGLPRIAEFALEYYAGQGDETMRAILASLKTGSSRQVWHARKLVQEGTAAYFQSKIGESLRFYDRARASLPVGASFDELWIKLKRADSLLRSTREIDVKTSLRLLNEVVEKARERKWRWLVGQALVSKGVGSMTSRNQDEIVPILKEGVNTLLSVDAKRDSARALNYLATIYFLAGDFETSLSTAYSALRVTTSNDHVRLTQLYWLASLQVYRMGFGKYALSLAKQAVHHAESLPDSGFGAALLPFVAMIHADSGDLSSGERYLSQAREARDRLKDPYMQMTVDLSLNLVCGKIKSQTGHLKEAAECLNDNLKLLSGQPKPDPYFYPQTLVQLARINTEAGKIDRARMQFRQAADIVEENDAYFASDALRMPFENQRRNLYEAVIEFEYDYGGKDAAWSYAQIYRSKIFLEFMRQMNPGIARVIERADDRRKVHAEIPADVQVLEYVLLDNRLLVWLVSRDKFLSTEVPVKRSVLEAKVAGFLEKINARSSVEREAEDLYRLLIEPLESHLDPKRALVIIPDQALHRLNFPALRSSATKRFLVERYTVLESPNLTTLLSASPGVPSRSSIVAFGAQRDTTFAARELRELDSIYASISRFDREAALKPDFLKSLSEAHVLHYAGHSTDASDPLRSSILLDGDVEGPNSITAVDISRQKMPANSVVVLASCDSSVGNSRDGIGMRGLTSAFLISGAGSVVGSLWLVEARSTSDLVLQFHKEFARGRPVAEALRQAQLAFIKGGKHPYDWSGFVVTGNTSALQ